MFDGPHFCDEANVWQASATSVVMQGFQWAVNDIIGKGRAGVSVINMSLGTERGVQQAFNDMVDSATANGVLSVVASGNGIRNPQTGAFIGPVSSSLDYDRESKH